MVKRLRRSMDIIDMMDDNSCSLAVHIVHTVHSSLRGQQLSSDDRLLFNDFLGAARARRAEF
ncbi:MAG: hypothetical protein GX945_14030 [Lentisphaerae bacterium]|nr:hypothetical protein [Lentisphaerota bacterium]